MGYLFLLNVVIVLIMADEVIMIFYDVLALQFIQQLDDIAFRMSKMEVLGERMYRATKTPFFHLDFQKEEGRRGLQWNMKMLGLKAIYFINLVGFLSAMIVVSIRQTTGYYQCDSITVRCTFILPITDLPCHYSSVHAVPRYLLFFVAFLANQLEMRYGKMQL